MENDRLVIVPRKRTSSRRRSDPKKMPPNGYTLHKPQCFYLKRVRPEVIMPAPAKRYPNTVDCLMCKPMGVARKTVTA